MRMVAAAFAWLAQFSRIPEMVCVMGLTCVGDLHHTAPKNGLDPAAGQQGRQDAISRLIAALFRRLVESHLRVIGLTLRANRAQYPQHQH